MILTWMILKVRLRRTLFEYRDRERNPPVAITEGIDAIAAYSIFSRLPLQLTDRLVARRIYEYI